MSEHTADSLTPQRVGAIRRRLLHWYDEHQQPFPWRSARDPWAALVAAVCSQQTQMSRVLPLWDRWMASFPTLQHAARASEAEALRVWGRGGYPKRALYLRRAAQQCVAQHHGALPHDEAALLALPRHRPIHRSDRAHLRIRHRLGRRRYKRDPTLRPPRPRRPATRARLERTRDPAHLRAPHAARRAERWNPAVMDFGGAVCMPRPRCHDCPLAHLCAARPRFAAGERAEPVRAQPPFSGSQRELRGMLMHVLRQIDSPLDRNDLLRTVATESGRPIDEIEAALTALVDAGLTHAVRDRVALGGDTHEYSGML